MERVALRGVSPAQVASGSGRDGQDGLLGIVRPLLLSGGVLALGFGSPGVARVGQDGRAGKGAGGPQSVR